MSMTFAQSCDTMLRTVLDAMPAAVFIVDEDVRIIDANRAAHALLQPSQRPSGALLRAGEALQCLNALDHRDGCGHSAACRRCVIRGAVRDALDGRHSLRMRTRMQLRLDGQARDAYFQITASGFHFQNGQLALLVLEDISEFAELRQIVPICAQCKKIRQDEDYWQSVEQYVGRYLDLSFSHSYCPACKQDLLRSIDGAPTSPTRNPSPPMDG